MKILVSDALPTEGLEVLKQHAEVDYQPDINAEELTARIGAAEPAIVKPGVRIVNCARGGGIFDRRK